MPLSSSTIHVPFGWSIFPSDNFFTCALIGSHGSYNWSRNAMSNNETLATALDKDFVKKFADEFMFLYNAHKHD